MAASCTTCPQWSCLLAEPIEDLVQAYRATAVAWDLMQSDAKKANRLFVRLHGIYKQLRNEAAGRAAISQLMNDPTMPAGVRLTAAAHSLGWEPETAIQVLESIERDGPGLRRVDAEHTLKAFREGTLNMDW